MKRILWHILSLPNLIYNSLMLRYRGVQCMSYPKINGRIYIVSRKGAIRFGRDVRINSSLQSNPIGGSTRTILFAEPGAAISIGNHVGISNSAIHASKEVIIEDDVLIGGNCAIYDTDFHSISYHDRMLPNDPSVKRATVRICKGAFIGAHSIVLKGVTIGENSVIAAGSVVTKNVPANELWGGSPARMIRKIDI